VSTSRFLHAVPALALAFLALGAPSALAAPARADGHRASLLPAFHGHEGHAGRGGHGRFHRPRPVVVAPRPAGRWELVLVPPLIDVRFDLCGRRYELVRVAGHWRKVWRSAPLACR
jgi:hypothetical protein